MGFRDEDGGGHGMCGYLYGVLMGGVGGSWGFEAVLLLLFLRLCLTFALPTSDPQTSLSHPPTPSLLLLFPSHLHEEFPTSPTTPHPFALVNSRYLQLPK